MISSSIICPITHNFTNCPAVLYQSMASSKRSWEGNIINNHTKPAPSQTEQPNTASSAMASENTGNEEGPVIQSIFENFRSELDEHHDRREKIIKASRDITALSKKMYDPADTPIDTFNFGLMYYSIAYSPYNGTVPTLSRKSHIY